MKNISQELAETDSFEEAIETARDQMNKIQTENIRRAELEALLVSDLICRASDQMASIILSLTISML